MFASVPFLIITLIVYGWISELRNLPGKCLMCYLMCLLIFYIQYSLTLNIEMKLLVNYNSLCILSGYIELTTILMCFLWLNVMCYDVWFTIRKVQKVGKSWKIILIYSLYAFGIPIVITITIFILHKENVIPEKYQLKLGEESCLIGGNDTIVQIYLMPVIILMLVINFIFYAGTACTIRQIEKQNSKIFLNQNQRYTQNKSR